MASGLWCAVRAKSFLIDREAVVCGPDGLSDFDALRIGRRAHEVTLTAFDLIELQAADLRDEPLLKRKQWLAKILGSGPDAIVYNEHLEQDGPAVFEHACRMGLEGIVSKRLDSPYRSGPSKTWLKSKNPLSEAAARARGRVEYPTLKPKTARSRQQISYSPAHWARGKGRWQTRAGSGQTLDCVRYCRHGTKADDIGRRIQHRIQLGQQARRNSIESLRKFELENGHGF